jgi:hypothetical protein
MQTESQSIDQTSKVPQPPRLEKPVRITEQVWPEETVPLVSICCIAYNHEGFIRDAIEGFLIQETTFPVEILIHDDASADGTADIIREHEAKYPQLIKPIYQTENQWSKGNKPGHINLARAKGEFIAVCEGDDYWTDAQKLQRQVDLLAQHPEYSAAVHWVMDESENGDTALPPVASGRDWDAKTVTVADLLEQNVITTCSVVFRAALFEGLSTQYATLPMGDWPLWIHLALKGPLVSLSDRMAVYRIHAGGLWSGMQPAVQLAGAASMLAAVHGALPYEFRERSLQSFVKYLKWAALRCASSISPHDLTQTISQLKRELLNAGLSPALPAEFDRVAATVVAELAASLLKEEANRAWEAGSYAVARRHYGELAFGPLKSFPALLKFFATSTGILGLSVKRAMRLLRGIFAA